MIQLKKADGLLALIRNGQPLTLGQQLRLTVQLSIPAVIAQLSSIVMQYIDAAMVGSLGAEASASIGLVSTTTWLFSGVCAAASTAFSVQVAHRIGAGDMHSARALLRQALTATFVFSLLLAIVGMAVSPVLPVWLGGDASIHSDATLYFFIFYGKCKFDQPAFRPVSKQLCTVLSAQGELNRPQQDRLSRAGLAGEHIKAGAELYFRFID